MPIRILGLDLGQRRIGVALSDSLGLTAGALTVLASRGLRADVEAVRALVTKHGVSRVVVGLPLTLRGAEGTQAKRAQVFAAALQRRGRVPVELVDERLTTVQGERVLRELGAPRRTRKRMVDQVAAQLILQHYLERQRHTP